MLMQKNHIKYKVINYNLLSSKSCFSIFQILGIQFIIWEQHSKNKLHSASQNSRQLDKHIVEHYMLVYCKPNGCQTITKYFCASCYISFHYWDYYGSAYKIKGFTNLDLTGVWKCRTSLMKTSNMIWNTEWFQGKMQLPCLPLQIPRI